MNIDSQISCIKNEISRRKKLYPDHVLAGKMSQDYSELEILKMQAVLQTLTQLKGIAK